MPGPLVLSSPWPEASIPPCPSLQASLLSCRRDRFAFFMLLWTVHLTPYTLSLLPLLSLLATSQPSFTLSAGTVDSSKPLWVPPPGRLDALPLGFKSTLSL